MKPPAFQFYADDFLSGTADMTAEEVGAYIRLLCHSWSKDGLVDDDNRLSILAGQCQASAIAHAKTKFGMVDGRLRNPRQEAERQKQASYRQKQAENGHKRWLGNAKPLPSHMPNACSPSPSPSPYNTLLTADAASEPRISSDEVWQAYPRKVGKKKATAIIKSLLSKNPPSFGPELLAKVGAYAAAVKRWPPNQEQFVPHPSTWFTRGSYDDDPATWERIEVGQPNKRPIEKPTPAGFHS